MNQKKFLEEWARIVRETLNDREQWQYIQAIAHSQINGTTIAQSLAEVAGVPPEICPGLNVRITSTKAKIQIGYLVQNKDRTPQKGFKNHVRARI